MNFNSGAPSLSAHATELTTKMVIAPDDPRLGRVGFAKLLGDGLELYAKKTEIIIGRQSKSTNLDVVLGENMNVSRQHAKIAYNSARGSLSLPCSFTPTLLQLLGPKVEVRLLCLQECGSCTSWGRTV